MCGEEPERRGWWRLTEHHDHWSRWAQPAGSAPIGAQNLMPRVAPPCSRSPDHRQSPLLLPLRPASGPSPPEDWAKYSFSYRTTPRLLENPWSGHRARSKKVTPTPAAIQVKTARRTAASHDPARSRRIAQHRSRLSPGLVLGFGVGASPMPVGETGFVGQGSPADGTAPGGSGDRGAFRWGCLDQDKAGAPALCVGPTHVWLRA